MSISESNFPWNNLLYRYPENTVFPFVVIISLFFSFRVEVTNKANQTPSHWVYTDMTLDEGVDLIYPFSTPILPPPNGGPASQSTFNSYMSNSVTNSPRFIQRNMSPYQPIYSNEGVAGQPPPPPYPPHLSTVMPLRTRSPLVQPRFLTANGHSSPPTTAPPPAPGSTGQRRRKRNLSSEANSKPPLYSGDSKPPFYALVKDSGSELYARPPSDHFYFKITDGKTEFI